jgi:hypothetical protein
VDLKEGQAVVFKNKNPKSEKSPTHTGEAKINGVVYRLSFWVNESKSSGEKYFGGFIEVKGEPRPQGTPPAQGQPQGGQRTPWGQNQPLPKPKPAVLPPANRDDEPW